VRPIGVETAGDAATRKVATLRALLRWGLIALVIAVVIAVTRSPMLGLLGLVVGLFVAFGFGTGRDNYPGRWGEG
jgi:biopolymer transport protein ExbB/TolQ